MATIYILNDGVGNYSADETKIEDQLRRDNVTIVFSERGETIKEAVEKAKKRAGESGIKIDDFEI